MSKIRSPAKTNDEGWLLRSIINLDVNYTLRDSEQAALSIGL